MSNTSRINSLDHNTANAITQFSEILTDYNPVTHVIDWLKNLPIDEKRPTPVPSILDLAKKVIKTFALYHGSIGKSTAHWSEEVKQVLSSLTKKILYPLSFCKIGRAVQVSIADNLVGNIAQSVTFAALQIFHIIPYILISSSIAGAITLYHSAPVALITFLAGSILMIQVYLIFKLVETLKTTNQTLEIKLDQLSHAINIVNFTASSLSSIGDLLVSAGKWSWSWVPPWSSDQSKSLVDNR